MSNIYNYFVNAKTVSYISSEYIDSNKIDVSNSEIYNKVQNAVKKVLDDTYNLLDKSKISKNNLNDAIDKFVNVSMKRLNLNPRQRNIAAPVNMRMPPQHSTNTRMVSNENESLDDKYSKYMQNYREFGQQAQKPEIPDFLQSKSTNPKRIIDEQMKHNNTPLDNFKGTATRKNNQVFNESQENNIEDYGGSSNFSFFNDTPEINSAFDEAFYNTGIDPSSINDSVNESVDERLKKMEAARSSLKLPEKQVNNIEELFQNDNEFKKHLNDPSNNQKNQNIYQRQPTQSTQHQNQYNPNQNNQNQYNPNQNQYNPNQNQDNMKLIIKEKEKEYSEKIELMHNKMNKYEEYLKTLMSKYNELKDERDKLKNHIQMNMNTNPNKNSIELMDNKKRELIQLSNEVQEKIKRLEQLQEMHQQE